jgi:hypothetical protein
MDDATRKLAAQKLSMVKNLIGICPDPTTRDARTLCSCALVCFRQDTPSTGRTTLASLSLPTISSTTL